MDNVLQEVIQEQEGAETSAESFRGNVLKVFPREPVDIRTYSPLALAFLGDAVYSLIVRTMSVSRGNRQAEKLHNETRYYVSASQQACIGRAIQPHLSEEEKRIYILPKPVEVTGISSLQRQLAHRWRPKPGGGFSENHELRLYRPGDRLNQVHWKLSAKTGKLILREPMEPQRGLVLLTMTLRGTPEELDRKLGRMIWLGNHILCQEIPFELRVLTGAGIECFSIANAQELSRTTDVLLASPTAADGSIRERSYSASWHYHIGGRPDEAR